MPFFVISNSNGDTYVVRMTEEELLKALRPEADDIIASDILEDISNGNVNYWGDGILIIKGEIIVPKAVKVVTRFEL